MAVNVDASAGTHAVRHHRDVAARIAAEIRRGPGLCRFAKVTSLMHAFRWPGTHLDIEHVLGALNEQGIEVSSGRRDSAGRPKVSRRDVLELTLDDAPIESSSVAQGPTVRVSAWRPGEPGLDERRLSKDAALEPGPGEVLWLDVDPIDADPSSEDFHNRVDAVTVQLQPWCPQLDDLMVRDLLTPDPQPKAETYGDERTGVRSLSVAAVIAREIPDDDDDFDGFDEQLIFQMVELIVGPGWILTCWHSSRSYAGNGEGHEALPLLREPFLSHVAHRWVHDDKAGGNADTPKNSADLGLYLARSLVATYGASLRMLHRWVSSWEISFYKSLSDHDKAKKLKKAAAEISNFLSMVGEFYRSVSAFRLAGEEMPNKSWFAEAQRAAEDADSGKGSRHHAAALAASVETAEGKLTHLSADIRADMDLLMIQSQASQQESSEQLQRHLGKVTGLVLVPTFVAGLFGANTALPGGGSWTGFDIMLVLMIFSGVVSYLAIRKLTE